MPAKLRVRAIPRGVEVRSPSRYIYFLGGVLIGIAVPMLAFGGKASSFALLALVPALALIGLALYITMRPTRLVFSDDRFTCGKLVHLTADIASFAVDADTNARIVLVTRGGARLRLPVSLDDVAVTIHHPGGEKKVYGETPRQVAEQVVHLLEEALDEARSAPAMFRVAASGPRIAEDSRVGEEEEDAEDDDEIRRRGAS